MTQAQSSSLPGIREDWLIICDFDGTIAQCDVTDAVLARFADPAWVTVESEWLAGEITARQCMDRQIRLMKVQPPDLDAFLNTVPLTDGFADFTLFCRKHGLNILVVSDGLDYVVKRVLSANGLEGLPVIANRLRFQGGSEYRLEFPYGVPGCASGVCKCAVAKTGAGEVVLIGDGHSDICLAGLASFVFARRDTPLHRHCLENGLPHAAYNDFFDMLQFLEQFHLHTAQERPYGKN